MGNEKMTGDNAFNLGVQTGINLMENKIQKHCELGKPVMANGELYWLTDSKEHLNEVMDDLDEECGVEKERKYIVPICREFGNRDKREMLIKATNAESAMFIAIRDFECNGWYNPWIVDRDSDNYKCLE